ncbi:MAG: alanine racemase [Fibrobacteria bacterium]|nr:alanine racemase [Fibrobacteria bacterium]
MSAPGSWIEVDRSSLAANVAHLRGLVGPSVQILVPVKADGYGHGAFETARAVMDAGADRVGVARVEEGAELRRQGFAGPLHVLGPFHPLDLSEFVDHGLVATICDPVAAKFLSTHAPDALACHLKVNTGMSRLGLHHANDRESIVELLSLPGIEWEGIFTHFSHADEPREDTSRQIERFDLLLAMLEGKGIRPPVAHAANSAGTLMHPSAHYQMVRPGIAIYGYDPTRGLAPGAAALRPALSLHSTVRNLSWIDEGETVSYGGMWTAPRRTRLAVLPLGYGDGFWRCHSGAFEVRIRGRFCPQVGRICMDLMMVDVTALEEIALGDPVTIIGPELPAQRLSDAAGTIVYEITCDLGRRLPRVFV